MALSQSTGGEVSWTSSAALGLGFNRTLEASGPGETEDPAWVTVWIAAYRAELFGPRRELLARSGGLEVKESLRTLLSTKELRARQTALEEVARVVRSGLEGGWGPLLVRYLVSPDPRVRVAAAPFAGALGRTVLVRLADPSSALELRVRALNALRGGDDELVEEALLLAMRDPDSRVSRAAALAAATGLSPGKLVGLLRWAEVPAKPRRLLWLGLLERDGAVDRADLRRRVEEADGPDDVALARLEHRLRTGSANPSELQAEAREVWWGLTRRGAVSLNPTEEGRLSNALDPEAD